ncbi:MAG: tRNA pseudouridine(55) synthase TruB [Clostridia bacterium]
MNGILVINKPKGYTSHDVVAKVKRILRVNKVGHTGTLDPNATGVLPLLLNNGTKLSKYLIQHDKTYEVVLRLGIKTDTLDEEGKVLEQRRVDFSQYSEGMIELVLQSLIGKQKQRPPMYSAIKINGKKLYEYARKGQEIVVPEREITIYDITLIAINADKNEIKFKVSCSKGTYIRSLCETIAIQLNTIGYMKELKRIQVGQFWIRDSITIESLEANKENENWLKEHIVSMKDMVKDMPMIKIEQKKLPHFLNGVNITIQQPDGIYQIYDEKNQFIGTGVVKNQFLKRDIIDSQF